jgi:hypothetical protein
MHERRLSSAEQFIIRVMQPDIHLDEGKNQLADEPVDLDGNNRGESHTDFGAVNDVYIPLSHIESQSYEKLPFLHSLYIYIYIVYYLYIIQY